jgi:hypothetical protein
MERCKVMLCKAGEPVENFTAACRAGVCVGTHK